MSHMDRDVAASAVTILLGVWLLAASFLWTHGGAAHANAVAVAAACIAVGLASLRAPDALLLDLLLAAWLVASIWILPHRDRFSSWNTVMVAIGLALLPVSMRLYPRTPGARAEA